MSILSESCHNHRLQRYRCTADLYYRTGKNYSQTDLWKLRETPTANGNIHQTSTKYCSDAVHRRLITVPFKQITRAISLSAIVWVLVCTIACSQPNSGSNAWVDGQGTACVTGGPVTASQPATLKFVFETGESGINTHGGILFHVSPYWNWSPPQMRSSDHPGFTRFEVHSENSVTVQPEFGTMPYILFRVEEGTLSAGDTLHITYGDPAGGRGAAMTDRYAESAQEFVFKTDSDGDGEFSEINAQPSVAVLPNIPAQLLITGPSEVSEGEIAQLRFAVLDRFGNWVQDWTGEVHLDDTSEFKIPVGPLAIGPSENNVIFLESRIPGIAHVTASIQNGMIRGKSNPIHIGSHESTRRLYWGDIHGHSVLSDGTGTPSDYYRYARYATACDFAALTDHDSWGFRPLMTSMDEYISAVETNQSPGEFCALFGYEWTSWTYGHRNVYSVSPDYKIYDSRNPDFDEPAELYSQLDPLRSLVIPHHLGGGPIPFDLRDNETALISVAEVISVHGVSDSYGSRHMIYNAQEAGFYRDALKMGYRWGAMASSDSHDGHPGLRTSGQQPRGLIAIRAETLSGEMIFDAIKQRRTYGTSGARIIVNFSVNDVEMGGVCAIASGESPIIHGEIIGESDLERVTLIRNGIEHKRFYGQGSLTEFHWQDESPVSSPTWYYLIITQMDEEIAVTSPIWCELR